MEKSMVCGKCGNSIKDDAVYCPFCGERVANGFNSCTIHAEPLDLSKSFDDKGKKKHSTLWITLGVMGGVVLTAVVVLLIIFFIPKKSYDVLSDGSETLSVFSVETSIPTVAELNTEIERIKPTAALTDATFSISKSDIEAEIEKIRTYYYSPGSDDKKIVLDNGTDGWHYSRDYRYHQDRLVFAFIFDGTEEHRLYFLDDHMIRYIDENHVIYDFPDTKSYQSWAEKAIKEAYALIDNGMQDVNTSAWLGIWKAESGESLEIYGETDNGLTLIFHKFSEQGNMMNIDYEMEFDNDNKTQVSEIGGPESHGGWEYILVLSDNYITVKSRYPDQLYFKE